MAKTISTATSIGGTYSFLPGSTGDFNVEAEGLTDVVFGQTFNSTETGVINWTVSANSYWKGHAGYVAELKKSGTSTATTGEAMTSVTSAIYKTTDTTKNVWDRTATVTVYDGVTDVTANVESIDYLYGQVTFTSGSEPSGTVTADFNYLPMSAFCAAREFTLTQTADAIETSDLCTLQGNSGIRTYLPGLRQVSLDLTGFYTTSTDAKAELLARNEVIIEIDPKGNGESICRGFFKPMSTGQSGDVGAIEDQTITYELSVPYSATETITPFSWNHTSTTLPTGVQNVLNAWENETTVFVQYLHDGTNGWKGESVVTDVSLSSGISAMNEFSANFQGSDAYTAVP